MKQLQFLLIVANTAAIACLMAIPIGKLLGMVAQALDGAVVFGWLVFFVPSLASVLALWGIQFTHAVLIRLFVSVAMPGSFLVACLALYMVWKGPSDLVQVGIGATILYAVNVLALWEPFKEYIESQNS